MTASQLSESDVRSLPVDDAWRGPIDTDEYDVVEKVAPGVIDRQSVSQPVQTGLKSIDAMVPIGRSTN